MKRRSFLQLMSGVAGGIALGQRPLFASPDDPARALIADSSGLPRRVLGRTGQKVSIITFPGLALTHAGQKTGTDAIHRAIDRGVNYLDVAPAYGDGDAEIKMGIGLEGIARDRYFLSCKTGNRTARGARQELERSLQRLKTDHFDLYQLHAMKSASDVERALGPDGAIETLVKAREEGKVKWLGFSAHSTESAVALMKQFSFETVMFPVNFIEYFTGDFAREVLDLAKQKEMGVIAIKPMSGGSWPRGMKRTRDWWYRPLEDSEQIRLSLRFALSLDPVVTAIPPAFLELFDKAVEEGKTYRPAVEDDLKLLRAEAAKLLPVFGHKGRKFAQDDALQHSPDHTAAV